MIKTNSYTLDEISTDMVSSTLTQKVIPKLPKEGN